MENTQTPLHISRRTFLGAVFTAVAIVTTVLAVTLQERTTSYEGDIPLPFGGQGSDVQGSILYYGKRNNINVYEVSFLPNERVERLQTDSVYLVHVPTGADVVTTSLDDVISTFNPSGIKNVDYYGYKYSDTVATAERAAVSAPLFKNRFPNQFFASKKARDNDPAHQNALATFETQNGVTFLKTDGTAGAVRLQPGSLYAFVVNETNGANIAIRTPVCRNGIMESAEVCDDGNMIDTDCCKNDCSGVLPPPAGTCSVSSSSASSVTSSIASSVASSQASSQASSGSFQQCSRQGDYCTKGININTCVTASIDCAVTHNLVCDGGACGTSACVGSCCRCVPKPTSASSQASSQAAIVYPLSIAVLQPSATTGSIVAGSAFTLLRFTATAGPSPVLIKSVMLKAQTGSLSNGTGYTLYREGVSGSVASAAASGSRLTFLKADGLGTVIAAGATVQFQVTATAAVLPALNPKVQLGFYTAPANFIIATVGGTMLGDIRLNGTCVFGGCAINVTTVPATVWTVQTAPPVCGTNIPDAGCEAGPSALQSCTAPYSQTCTYCSPTCKIVSVAGPYCGDHISKPVEQKAGVDGTLGTDDDETCDDGRQCSSDHSIDCTADPTVCPGGASECVQINDDSCSNLCKLVAVPFGN